MRNLAQFNKMCGRRGRTRTADLYRVKAGGVVSLRKIDLLLSSPILGVGFRRAEFDHCLRGIWRRSDSLPSPVLMPGLCAQEWRRELSLAGCGLVEGACITRSTSTANANPQGVSINSRSIITNPQPDKVVNPNSAQQAPFEHLWVAPILLGNRDIPPGERNTQSARYGSQE